MKLYRKGASLWVVTVRALFTIEPPRGLIVFSCGVMVFSFVDHVYHGNIRTPFA